MMTDVDLSALAGRLGAALQADGWRMATAESCTGGWIAKTITDVAGSSAWFDSALISYSNVAKTTLLQVPASLIEEHGAVSREVVMAMANGALQAGRVPLSVAVSGIAGPEGGTAQKPVGLVWFAWAGPWGIEAEEHRFKGARDTVRRQSVQFALQGLLDRLGD